MSSEAAQNTIDEEEAHFFNVVATFRKYGPYAVMLAHAANCRNSLLNAVMNLVSGQQQAKEGSIYSPQG